MMMIHKHRIMHIEHILKQSCALYFTYTLFYQRHIFRTEHISSLLNFSLLLSCAWLIILINILRSPNIKFVPQLP